MREPENSYSHKACISIERDLRYGPLADHVKRLGEVTARDRVIKRKDLKLYHPLFILCPLTSLCLV